MLAPWFWSSEIDFEFLTSRTVRKHICVVFKLLCLLYSIRTPEGNEYRREEGKGVVGERKHI